MSRSTIRRRFLFGSMVSAVAALVLFVGALVFAMLLDGDAEQDIRQGDSYRGESLEMIFGAMAVAVPLGLVTAFGTGAWLSRRSARPIEDAIRAARETTAHDLKRSLPVPGRDDELRDLVVSLNELFVRLDDGFGALSRFAADASHELRTPLAVMATEIEVALRHPRSVEEWEATGRASLEELRRVSALVEGLLVLARAGADAPAARTQVQLVECVDAVIAQLGAAAEHAGVTIGAPAEAASEPVAGNPVMLEIAIRNLVENAIAATPRGGQIQLSVEDASASSTILVDDSGPGLGADREALFAPFQRGTGDSADTAKRKAGVGLGLAIARRIAVAHGGTLTADTSPLGGARFKLVVPTIGSGT